MRFVIFVFIAFTFCFFPKILRAEIIFTEIMYDLEGSDTDGEWVEIQNTGTEDVNLTGYKFNDGSNHGLNIPPANGGQGSLTISPGDYIIIADNAEVFLIDHPGFANSVIDTVMSLANTSDTISILTQEGFSVTTTSYTSDLGANGDGTSLNFVNGVWVSGPESPGLPGSGGVSNEEDDQENNEDDSAETTGSGGESQSSSQKISIPFVDMTTIPKNSVVGVPFIVNTNVFGYQQEPIRNGKFVWTFGDGTRKESNLPEPFHHVYQYEGEYVVTFEYFQNPYTKEPFIFSQTNITVSTGGVVISAIEKDGTIILENKGTSPRDLGGWTLVSTNTSFYIPKYTVILPRKKLMLPSTLTLFPNNPDYIVSLKNPSGAITSRFPEEKELNKEKVLKTSTSRPPVESTPRVLGEFTSSQGELSSAKPLETSKENNGSKHSTTSILSLVGLVILGVVAVVSVRRISKKDSSNNTEDPSDDFEIIE